MRPENLILRCYAYRINEKLWYAHCIDLNVDAEASSFEAVKSSLDNAILGYLLTVLETKDRESLAFLLSRPSPLKHRIVYYLIKWLRSIHVATEKRKIFKDAVPVHVAHDCA